MQLVLCDENTMYYIKTHLRCVFGFKNHDFKEHYFKVVKYLFIIKPFQRQAFEKVLYPIPKYLGNCLERVTLFIFLLTLFEQVA